MDAKSEKFSPQQEAPRKIGYRDVFTQTEYIKNMSANLISRFGDSVDSIAYTWLVYQITGSAAWSAIIFAMNRIPSVVVQPFAGALVEGMNKKKLMVLADAVRAIIVAALAILYITGQVTPWILLLFTLIISTVEAFCLPASASLLPRLLKEEYYEFGTALNSSLSTVVELIGLGMAGVIIGLFGIETAIFIDAATFLCSCLIRLTLKIREENLHIKKSAAKEYLTVLKDGIFYMKGQPVICNYCILAVFANAILVPFNALQSPLVSEVMGQGETLLSVMGIAVVAGMGIGSFLYPYISRRASTRSLIVAGGVFLGIAVSLFSLGTYVNTRVVAAYGLTVFCSLLMGFSASIVNAHLNVRFIKTVSQDYLARAIAILGAAASAATPLVSLLIGALTEKLSTAEIMLWSGVLCVILFLYVGLRKIRLE
ncbi:MAG: MFS transporter [Lachnospiraceae bacterium]|nr:MFS transporter [Lachnospiraceae bacterium]